MKRKRLQERLAALLKQEQWLLWLGSGLSFMVGLFVLYITFWMAYGVLWFTTGWWVSLSHQMLLVGSSVFVVLLFVGNATTDRKYLDTLELNIGPHRAVQVSMARASGYGWLLAFSDGKAARSTVKMLTTLLYTGPRILMQTWHLLRRALRMGRIDVERCISAIGEVIKTESRVSFDSLMSDLPESQIESYVEDLSFIEGVVILRSDPVGLTLSPEFMEKLKGS